MASPPSARPIHWIDDPDHIPAAVSHIARLAAAAHNAIAIDLEGVSLGRSGEVCILQISTDRHNAPIWLFDVTRLGGALFEGEASLAALLRSAALEKLFFDCRSDVNALFHHYGVRPANVLDLQLLDVAQRKLMGVACNKVSGLGFICDRTPHARLSFAEKGRLAAVKAAALALFAPEAGGSYAVWKARPLPPVLVEYCTDSALFFSLKGSYYAACPALAGALAPAVAAACERRLDFGCSEGFERAGKEACIGIDPLFLEDMAARGALFPEPPLYPPGTGRSWAGGGR